MSGTFGINMNDISDELRASINAMDLPVKEACTAAVTEAGIKVRDRGRSDISAAGFSSKWQQTWKVLFYQVSPPQIDAAAWLYHLIPYSDVFQEGATIHGKPDLWIPLRNAPKNFGKGHITPRKLVAGGVKLFEIKRAGKPKLLAVNIFATKAVARRAQFDIAAKKIRQSHTGSSVAKLAKASHPSQSRVTVPLFFAVSQITLKKRFHLTEIAADEADHLAQYYVDNLKPE